MDLSKLRGLRIFFSLLFFLSIAALFLDLYNSVPDGYIKYILFLQFIPSIINYINLVSISSAGFLIILLLTLLFGRVYCSAICPLGIFQDLISRIKKKFIKRTYFKKLKDYKKTKYLILSLSIISVLCGSSLSIILLDPFSNFGRIFSNLFRPMLILINNFISSVLIKLDVYFLYTIELKSIEISIIIITFLILLIIFFFSYNKGRLFCNMICPVGILFGLISKVSLYKIGISEDKCNSCNLCTKVCKSGCIDKINKDVDFSRCVACYNCLSVCPTGGINYKNSFKTKKNYTDEKYDRKKRELISKTLIYFAGLSGLSFAQIKIIPKKESKIPVNKKSFSSPPGSKSTWHFTSTCTGCQLCVSSCPPQVLQPSLFEYGILGILQPYMDYKTGFCNFECKICSDICPSGAILELSLESKKLIQIGKAKFIKENCIVETESTECGACSEHCPTKAVKMIPYKKLHLPEVKEEYCIGCGACEFACPTKPYKSIYVEGNLIHLTAKKIPVEKLKENIDFKEDFPF